MTIFKCITTIDMHSLMIPCTMRICLMPRASQDGKPFAVCSPSLCHRCCSCGRLRRASLVLAVPFTADCAYLAALFNPMVSMCRQVPMHPPHLPNGPHPAFRSDGVCMYAGRSLCTGHPRQVGDGSRRSGAPQSGLCPGQHAQRWRYPPPLQHTVPKHLQHLQYF